MRNKLLLAGLSAVLIGAVSTVQAGVIHSDINDGMLEVRDVLPPEAPWPQVHSSTLDGSGWQLSVGEWYGPGLTTIVLPFELPNLGATANPFTSVDFGVLLNPNSTPGAATDIDLYAVRVDANPAILTSDWYSGSAFDPGATLIQESFLTGASPRGWDGVPNNNTDAAGDAALLSYMNTAYDSGAGAGNFIFLRLSYGSDTLAAGWDTYNINAREATGGLDGMGEWPVITFDAIPEPATLGLLGLSGLTLWIRRKMS